MSDEGEELTPTFSCFAAGNEAIERVDDAANMKTHRLSKEELAFNLEHGLEFNPDGWDLYIEGHFCGREYYKHEVGDVSMMDSKPHPTEYRPNGSFIVTEVTDQRITMERHNWRDVL